jgi:hypothetical protein
MADPAHPPGLEAGGAELQADRAMPVLYTNRLAMIVGLYDFTFVFGHRLGTGEEGNREIAIVMSPQHAAAMRLALTNNLKAYEAKFGPIKLPGDLIAQMEGVAPPLEGGQKGKKTRAS